MGIAPRIPLPYAWYEFRKTSHEFLKFQKQVRFREIRGIRGWSLFRIRQSAFRNLYLLFSQFEALYLSGEGPREFFHEMKAARDHIPLQVAALEMLFQP